MDRSIANGLGMKYLFYEDWANKRIDRVVSIFGKGWFNGKTVLELGAAHGDIGIELLKLGADVTFSDVRQEHLTSISNNLKQYNFTPKTICFNQNEKYDLGKKFDLVLHIGVIYHVENWKQDLECALNHTSTMILESAVYPTDKHMRHPVYGPFKCENPQFTQEEIEEHLTSLGCKFIRFDIPELDCMGGWLTSDMRNNHLYSWTKERENIIGEMDHYRRFWLVLK